MSKRSGPTPPRPWVPMGRAEQIPPTPEQIDTIRRITADERLDAEPLLAPHEMWKNDRYTVIADRDNDGHVTHLSIRRNDRKPLRDWRDMQRIKNEVAGSEVEAVEMYPAESCLIDGANQFHLFCLPPGEHFEMGWHGTRRVADDRGDPTLGSVQRPLTN